MTVDKQKNEKLIIKIVIVLFVVLMCFLIFFKTQTNNSSSKVLEEKKTSFFNSVVKNTNVNVTKYSIYGTHFNIEGTLDIIPISGIKVSYVDLIIKDLNQHEITLESEFNYTDNTISFSTSKEINSGLDLESLQENNYYILLKLTLSNSDIKYYSLSNSSEYGNTDYYTITKNKSNNKVSISFSNYNDTPYMSINVSKINELPSDVYDIAIDPGHGGLDVGAKSGEYNESKIALDGALKLKSKLEALGLKVFLSRNESSSPKEDTANNMYDDNGRINILNRSKAKIIISLHLNSSVYNKNTGGIEVYAPSNCNLDFAQLLAKNIVEKSNSYYSELKTFKKADRCICS